MVSKKNNKMEFNTYFVNIKNNLKKFFSKTENIFLVVSLPAIATFLYITPQSWGLDEQVHVARVYQIADGGTYPDSTPGGYGGLLPASLVNVLNYGHRESNQADRELPVYNDGRKDVKDSSVADMLGSEPINSNDTQFYNFGTTGPYSPLVYLPAVVGMKTGMIFDLSVDQALTLSRLAQALFYITCGYMALRLLARYKLRWLFFTVALLPMSIFLAITINADAYTNGIVVLFAAIMTRLYLLRQKMNTTEEYLLYALSIALMLTKPSYAVALLLVLFLPRHIFTDTKKMYIKKGLLVLFSTIIFMLFALKGLQYGDSMSVYFSASQAEKISMLGQMYFIATHPMDFLDTLVNSIAEYGYVWQSGIVGMLGYNSVGTPHALVAIASSTVLLAALYADKLRRSYGYVFFAAGLVSAVSVMVLLYLTFNEIGFYLVTGVQGRYFIPCLLLAGIGLSAVIGASLSMSKKAAAVIFSLSSFVVLYVTLLAYYAALF